MKLKNIFLMAQREMWHYAKMFLLYLIILILLSSVSTAMINVAMYLPEHISELVRIDRLDEITVCIKEWKTLDAISGNNDIEILDIGNSHITNGCLDLFEEDYEYYGGVILEERLKGSEMLQELKEAISEGGLEPRQQNETNCFPIWVSDEMAEVYGLQCGDEISIISKTTTEKQKVYIQGIYKYSVRFCQCYFSESAYELLGEQEAEWAVYLRTIKFRDIFRLTAYLNEEDIDYFCYNMLLDVMRMFYMMLYAFSIAVIGALYSILLHLMNLYYDKRRKNYAIYSAIGMSHRDVTKILFLIGEFILLIVAVFSYFGTKVILEIVKEIASTMLDFEMNQYRLMSNIPVFLNFVLMQMALLIIVRKFYRMFEKAEIVQYLRSK